MGGWRTHLVVRVCACACVCVCVRVCDGVLLVNSPCTSVLRACGSCTAPFPPPDSTPPPGTDPWRKLASEWASQRLCGFEGTFASSCDRALFQFEGRPPADSCPGLRLAPVPVYMMAAAAVSLRFFETTVALCRTLSAWLRRAEALMEIAAASVGSELGVSPPPVDAPTRAGAGAGAGAGTGSRDPRGTARRRVPAPCAGTTGLRSRSQGPGGHRSKSPRPGIGAAAGSAVHGPGVPGAGGRAEGAAGPRRPVAVPVPMSTVTFGAARGSLGTLAGHYESM